MYKLAFFIPVSHLHEVKAALFEAGAGRIGNYDCCAWETAGTGQFRALEGSDPFIGEQGKIEEVEEYKVEMVCPDHLIKQVVHVLRQVHPYEEPAFDIWRLEEL